MKMHHVLDVDVIFKARSHACKETMLRPHESVDSLHVYEQPAC